MNIEDFAIAFSDKEGEEAIKEVSLKIKRIFPKKISYLMLLFTAHYSPAQILKPISFTLKPNKLLAVQTAGLIFEGNSFAKGIVACCINKEGLSTHEAFLEAKDAEEIESFFASSFKNVTKKDHSFLSFLSPSINPGRYLNNMKLSLGEAFKLIGAGYVKKYASNSYQIINSKINEGLATVALKGLNISLMQIGGYVPLGKPFKITKLVSGRNLIMEINHRLAANLYRYYFEEKYDEFMKKKLFSLYPLGVKKNGSTQLINVIECLQDGSLMYSGELKEGAEAHLMLLDTTALFSDAKSDLLSFQKPGGGLYFIINSLMRKTILKELANEEMAFIKRSLGNQAKIIGLYSDYTLSASQNTGYADLETGNILLSLWD